MILDSDTKRSDTKRKKMNGLEEISWSNCFLTQESDDVGTWGVLGTDVAWLRSLMLWCSEDTVNKWVKNQTERSQRKWLIEQTSILHRFGHRDFSTCFSQDAICCSAAKVSDSLKVSWKILAQTQSIKFLNCRISQHL